MVKEETTEAIRPLITAVMPVYNGERHLRETLNHIVEIQEQGMELLLIDDGSTDTSGAICREYELLDRRIRYIRQDNQGIAGSRNRGIELARGEYICFWDQDDIVLPEGYFKLLYKIQAGYGCMGMCSTKRMIGEEMSAFEKITEGVYDEEEVRRKLLYPLLFRGYTYSFAQGTDYLYGSVWKCIFRTDFVKENQINFRRFVNYEDDWIFVTRALCCADRVVTSRKAGYCWRVNEGSESHRGVYIPDLCERFAALDEYVIGYLKEGIREAEVLTEYRKVSMCEHYVELCRNAANIRYARDKKGGGRRAHRERMKSYLWQTNYKKCLTCRKYLRSSAYRRRIVLFTLRYGGVEAARIVSGIYGRLETGLSGFGWITRMERQRKMAE
ncbi:MAG: glycosyltransferase family 2 protein [Lachnospiraceae bacterium]|nr:glycosyltransferase family 2 protein [Lachnospiraceae bacterium]